jgi:uncharacterized protein
MEKAIASFIECRRLAIVGASRISKKFGNYTLAELKKRGFETFVIHPEAAEIGGETCYPNLDAVKNKVDGVWVCVPPDRGARVLQDAATAGLKRVWLQMGAESPELVALGKELGLEMVAGKCILMYAKPVTSFHSFHRFIWQLIGKY